MIILLLIFFSITFQLFISKLFSKTGRHRHIFLFKNVENHCDVGFGYFIHFVMLALVIYNWLCVSGILTMNGRFASLAMSAWLCFIKKITIRVVSFVCVVTVTRSGQRAGTWWRNFSTNHDWKTEITDESVEANHKHKDEDETDAYTLSFLLLEGASPYFMKNLSLVLMSKQEI